MSVPGRRRRQSGGISATIRSRNEALRPLSTGPVTGCGPGASVLAAAAGAVEPDAEAEAEAAASLLLV